jgi:predicted porin
MNQWLFAGAFAGLAMVAQEPARAQDSLTLFGNADLALEAGRYNANVRQTRLQSGDLVPSRLGLTGHEDLGGGYGANVYLEMGIALDTGVVSTDGTLFTRGSYAGIEGPGWRLDAGRMFVSLFWIYLNSDASTIPAATSGASAALQHSAALGKSGTAGFYNNVLRLRTKPQAGLETEWSYSLGSELGGARRNDGRNLGMNVQYRPEGTPLWLGYGFNQATVHGALDPADLEQTTHMAGVVLNFGTVGLGLNGMRSKHLTSTHTDIHSWALSARMRCGPGEVNIGTARLNESGARVSQAAHLGYVLALSKQTSVYSYANRIGNNALATRGMALLNGSYATVDPGFDPATVTFGLRSAF